MPSPTTETSLIVATGSNALSTETLTTSQLNALPLMLTSEQEAAIEKFCRSPIPEPEPCGDERFAWAMRALSILPRRADDDVKGELRAKLYRAKLRHCTEPQIIFVVDKALERFTFFPTIKELLDVAAEWIAPASDALALRRRLVAKLNASRQARFDALMDRLKARDLTQDEIDALPERIRMIALDKGYLWLHPDQSYTVRSDCDAGRFTPPGEEFFGPIKDGIADELGLTAGSAAA